MTIKGEERERERERQKQRFKRARNQPLRVAFYKVASSIRNSKRHKTNVSQHFLSFSLFISKIKVSKGVMRKAKRTENEKVRSVQSKQFDEICTIDLFFCQIV
jgi:hypothetical protein